MFSMCGGLPSSSGTIFWIIPTVWSPAAIANKTQIQTIRSQNNLCIHPTHL